MKTKKQTRLNKGAGVLLPVASLPSNYGIGTFGEAAYRFVDFAEEAGLRYWQVLPLGPTGFGDSPYQSFSAFAGNPYFIDLDILVHEGLLGVEDVADRVWFETEEFVDYEKIHQNRFDVLRKAFSNSDHMSEVGYAQFCEENANWLEDYALYMSLKNTYSHSAWYTWPTELKQRNPEALQQFAVAERDELDFWKFIQYKFLCQWLELKQYATDKNVQIIGDIPMYIAMDSADAWVHYLQLHMDDQHLPTFVAGVPPDLFSETGQLWGNPLYDWDKMARDDYSWWRSRIRHSSKLFDIIRIDHFLGVANYYCIPYGCESAETGEYRKGPGMNLVEALQKENGMVRIIAEDLGIENEEVKTILKASGYPGMKVLLFAFDGDPKNPNLPEFIEENTVAYGGTHDNDTLRGYLEEAPEESIRQMERYFGENDKELLVEKIIKTGFGSAADVVIFQMQDYLGLGNEARINEPSTLGKNWKWRLLEGHADAALAEKIRTWKMDR